MQFLSWVLETGGGAATAATGGFVAGLAWLGGMTLWERLKPEPPADFTLTLTDPNGIPIKEQKMSAKGAGRMIADLNHFPNLYK